MAVGKRASMGASEKAGRVSGFGMTFVQRQRSMSSVGLPPGGAGAAGSTVPGAPGAATRRRQSRLITAMDSLFEDSTTHGAEQEEDEKSSTTTKGEGPITIGSPCNKPEQESIFSKLQQGLSTSASAATQQDWAPSPVVVIPDFETMLLDQWWRD